ncbi:hypothetical protein [Streptomyces sp. S.PNR 29]|uniref:hypothetical protein n=1 Tax=Streptomyces sp. S.PNR 29 TaxID=2973805 RepID=UPI0025AF1C0B|nr:hypothetical protein [Streptomyces sp. S.PNR 29]MDN0194834.1 hypothetical protein [Streptomyces sp. S.PNR 29]
MTAIPYHDGASHPAPLTFQWTRTEAGGEVTYAATGRCPVCGCLMTRSWTFGQPVLAKGGFRGRRAEPGQEPYHTHCRCETLHMGRPAGEQFGCGALLAIAPPQATANGPAS